MTDDTDAGDGRAGADSTARSDALDPYRLLGAVATVVALGGIALATLLDPTFSWTGDALSHLGVRDRSAPVFNGGLALGGVLGLGYAVGLWRCAAEDGAHTVEGDTGTTGISAGTAGAAVRLRAALFALSMVAMAGVGVYDLTRPLHGPAAVAFYTFLTATLAVDGVARRRTATGRVALAFVPVHVVVWATFLGGYWPVTGLALPELPGALMLAAWVWIVGPLPVLAVGPSDEGRSGDGS